MNPRSATIEGVRCFGPFLGRWKFGACEQHATIETWCDQAFRPSVVDVSMRRLCAPRSALVHRFFRAARRSGSDSGFWWFVAGKIMRRNLRVRSCKILDVVLEDLKGKWQFWRLNCVSLRAILQLPEEAW